MDVSGTQKYGYNMIYYTNIGGIMTEASGCHIPDHLPWWKCSCLLSDSWGKVHDNKHGITNMLLTPPMVITRKSIGLLSVMYNMTGEADGNNLKRMFLCAMGIGW